MIRAQWAEHPTEKPGAVLMQCRVTGASRDFSPIFNFLCDLSLTVSIQCVVVCIIICAHIKKNQTLAAIPLFRHTEILHTPTGIGTAALAAAVPYPGKAA